MENTLVSEEEQFKQHNCCIIFHKSILLSIAAPGLEKRQCTLQITFQPEGNQPRLAIIFRGNHIIEFNGMNLATGIYIIKMDAKSLVDNKVFSESNKVLLLK